MAALTRFFAAASGPMVCGVNDCCVAVADAIQDRFGVDIMAGRRDAYRTPKQAVKEALRRGNRNVAQAIVQAAVEAGFIEVSGAPEDWDIALIRYVDMGSGREELAPGLRMSGYWMVRSHAGVSALHAEPARFYRYGH